MYKATPSDEDTWNTIRSLGFTRTVLGPCPKFTNNVDAAFALAFVSSTKRSSASSKQSRQRHRGFGRLSDDWSSATRALYPILEGKEGEEYSNLCCWIVATIRFDGDGTNEQTVRAPRSGNATTWNLGHPELALPFVNFHSKLRHTDMVSVLRNGLSQIVYDHFKNKTNMEGVKATVGRDFKKQKISDGSGDDDQVKVFNSGGDNNIGSLITHKTAE